MRDTVGKPLALGIAAGIDAEADAVQDSLDAIASEAANPFEIPGTVAGIPATGGTVSDNSTININVYAHDGMNIRQLAEEISDILALQQRQKQAAWGLT